MYSTIFVFFTFLPFISTSFHNQNTWSTIKNKKSNFMPLGLGIIGGNEALPHSYPFQVGLLINNNNFCAGTLISQNYVLTAAHCGVVIDTSVDIILGAHNITKNEETQVIIKGNSTLVHELYNGTNFDNDIALIKLSTPAPLNDVISTVKLPSKSDANKTYFAEEVLSIGWGLENDTPYYPTTDDLSDVLRVVNVTTLDIYYCGQYYDDAVNRIVYISERNLCTSGYKNRGTCNGDSGGPLIFENTQIGIVSFGTDLCEMCSPSVYTNLGKFLDWIEENSDVIIQ